MLSFFTNIVFSVALILGYGYLQITTHNGYVLSILIGLYFLYYRNLKILVFLFLCLNFAGIYFSNEYYLFFGFLSMILTLFITKYQLTDDTFVKMKPYEKEIRQFLFIHNPSKLHKVDDWLVKYAGREKTLIENLKAKYLKPPSPEPTPESSPEPTPESSPESSPVIGRKPLSRGYEPQQSFANSYFEPRISSKAPVPTTATYPNSQQYSSKTYPLNSYPSNPANSIKSSTSNTRYEPDNYFESSTRYLGAQNQSTVQPTTSRPPTFSNAFDYTSNQLNQSYDEPFGSSQTSSSQYISRNIQPTTSQTSRQSTPSSQQSNSSLHNRGSKFPAHSSEGRKLLEQARLESQARIQANINNFANNRR